VFYSNDIVIGQIIGYPLGTLFEYNKNITSKFPFFNPASYRWKLIVGPKKADTLYRLF
jgi:hypothetical protein